MLIRWIWEEGGWRCGGAREGAARASGGGGGSGGMFGSSQAPLPGPGKRLREAEGEGSCEVSGSGGGGMFSGVDLSQCDLNDCSATEVVVAAGALAARVVQKGREVAEAAGQTRTEEQLRRAGGGGAE